MKILMLHNRYDIRGGEDESTDAECSLLRQMGHEIVLLEAFNSNIGNGLGLVKTVKDTFWSSDWFNRVERLLSDGGFDVMHVQNFFPLISPSVYFAAKKHGVPVVQAVRNYRLICPAASLFRDGHYCDECLQKTFKWPAVKYSCYRGSRAGSAVLASMTAFHKFKGTWRDKVHTYVAISQYVRERLIEGGFPAEKIVVKPNFAHLETGGRAPDTPPTKEFILYVGRLTEEKGAHLLLKAYEDSGSTVPLKLIGAGELELPPSLRGRVEIAGKKPLSEVYENMRRSLAVVMPGAWPEPFGRVAVEAFANGAPVIASDIAGCSEIISHGKTGLLFKPGNVDELALAIKEVQRSPQAFERMGDAARQEYLRLYTPSVNAIYLDTLYKSVFNE